MFAKYSVGAQRAAPALARHLLCPKTTLYSAGINTFTWQEFLHALCTLDRKWCKRRAKEPGGRTALIAMLLLKWLPHLSKAGRATGVSPCFCTLPAQGSTIREEC